MPDQSGGCEYHYVLIDFHCTVHGGELRPGDDAQAVQWFEIHSLGDLTMTDGTREVITVCSSRPGTRSQVTRP